MRPRCLDDLASFYLLCLPWRVNLIGWNSHMTLIVSWGWPTPCVVDRWLTQYHSRNLGNYCQSKTQVQMSELCREVKLVSVITYYLKEASQVNPINLCWWGRIGEYCPCVSLLIERRAIQLSVLNEWETCWQKLTRVNDRWMRLNYLLFQGQGAPELSVKAIMWESCYWLVVSDIPPPEQMVSYW